MKAIKKLIGKMLRRMLQWAYIYDLPQSTSGASMETTNPADSGVIPKES